MAIAEYARMDGLALAELVKSRDVKPVELIDEAIARAERLNPALNFLVFRDFERARQRAGESVGGGTFAGVPFFLKDIFGLAEGMPTRQAARFMPAFPWPRDCDLVARFKTAGLVALGKTNVPEFGLVPTTESKLYGPARNPWNREHSTGGSSGGSAAAVAARVVPLAHANDGGGSIRIPASCCGLVGLKPTRGRTTLGPDFGDVIDGLANEHVLTRSVRDSAAVLDAIAGNVAGDPYWAPPPAASYLAALREAPKPLRIAISTKSLEGQAHHPDCTAAVLHAARLCESLGHRVEEAAPALSTTDLMPAFMAMWSANLAAGIDTIAQLTGQTPGEDQFEGLTWGLYEAGKRVTASEYLRSKSALQMAARASAQFHQTYDVWLTTTLAAPPAKLGTFDMEEKDPARSFAPFIAYVPFTAMQNVTGQPAINVPLFWNGDNLPIGVQFVGRFGDEKTLLQLAAHLEQASPWEQRVPNLEA